VAQAVPAAAAEFDDAELVTALAKRLDPADVQLYYQMALLGKRDLGLAPSARSGFEMTMLRMLAFQPMDGAPAVMAGAGEQAALPQASAPRSAAPIAATPAAGVVPAATVTAPGAWREPDWASLAESLGLKGAAQQLAANCVYRRREGSVLYLEINPAHQQMITSQSQGRLEEALSRHFGEALKVKVQVAEGALATPAKLDEQREAEKLAAARDAIAADPLMRQLGETFGTQINPDLVKPAD
ncbi:MAG TPA: DNA polymerase III subunit gamma/tau C-terminal domain-containing protein, partial [Gammaproteobacteria bacterium]|jgi:DNA polymerase-3 subunit gamma/tau